MGYAVYHLEKKKSLGGSLGNHIDRTEGMEHTYPHADKEKKNLNKIFALKNGIEKLPLAAAVQKRISEGYISSRKIRNDAVKYIAHVLTGSHDDMKKIFSDQQTAKKWIEENYKFLAQEYGNNNIVRFNLHLDEKTPHLHAVTVPLTEKGTLSAREVIGNRSDLKKRQDRYAERMKIFGLERGISNTGVKHENAKEYYKRINLPFSGEITPVKGLLGVDKDKTIDKYKESLKTAKIKLNELENINRINLEAKKLSEQRKEKAIEMEQKYYGMRREKERLKSNFEIILKSDKMIEQQRELIKSKNLGKGRSL